MTNAISDNRNVRVLIVEDEPLVSEMLLEILEAMKYQVVGVAIDGIEAVDMAQTAEPDVILMDIGLNEIDGVEATRRIQLIRPTPIVALTAYDNREILNRATEAGVGAYLTKPTDPSSLKSAITTVIARFNDMMELRRLNTQLQEEIAIRKRAEEERVRLLSAERDQRVLAEILTEVTLALTSLTRPELVLDEILHQAKRIIPFHSGAVFLLEGDILRPVRWQGYGGQQEFVANLVIPLSEFAINAHVVRTQAPLVLPDVHKDPRWVALDETAWIGSALLVPICLHQRVLGMLHFNSASTHAFSYADTERLMPLASAAGIAIENARLMEGLEATVAARTAEIVAERDKNEAILRSAADAIAVLDESLCVQYVNPAFEQLTGYTWDESIGQVIHALLRSTLPAQGLAEMRISREMGSEWSGEPVVMRKDGRTYEAAMTIAPVCDADEVLQGYVVSHQDITRFKALDRARNQFITSISHELRTPLTILDLSLRKLQRQVPSDRDRRSITTMAAQIEQLVHFTEDILEMAALDSGKGVRGWEPVQIAALVLDTVRRYAGLAATNNVDLVAKPAPLDLPVIKGDQRRVAQMLAELVENAVTFTLPGGHVAVEVKSVEDATRNWVTLSVQDTGPGILPEEREKVFDRFFRGHLAESGHILGTGLGLSIVQAIAQAHGGRITVDSVVDEGSTFTIWLPAAD